MQTMPLKWEHCASRAAAFSNPTCVIPTTTEIHPFQSQRVDYEESWLVIGDRTFECTPELRQKSGALSPMM